MDLDKKVRICNNCFIQHVGQVMFIEGYMSFK